MKKKLLIVLCCALAFCLSAGCATKNGQSNGTSNGSTATESTPDTEDSESEGSDSSFQPIIDGGNFDVGENYQ